VPARRYVLNGSSLLVCLSLFYEPGFWLLQCRMYSITFCKRGNQTFCVVQNLFVLQTARNLPEKPTETVQKPSPQLHVARTRSVGLLLYRQSPADLRYGSVLAADPQEQRMRLNNNISLLQGRMSSSIMCCAPPNVDILSRSKSLASLKLSPCNRTSTILRFPDSCR
jgi:hypothetical protein